LRHILPILIGDTDVIESDAVWLPVLWQLFVEGHEVHTVLSDVSPYLPEVQTVGSLDLWSVLSHAQCLQPRNDLFKRKGDITTDFSVVPLASMPKITVDLAVAMEVRADVPRVLCRHAVKIDRVLARTKPECDENIFLVHTPPEFHGLIVATEHNIAIAERILGRNGVGSVDGPYRRGVEQLRKLRAKFLNIRAERRFLAHIDNHPSMSCHLREPLEENLDILFVKDARRFSPGNIHLSLF
jgi:hypothetical protein